VTGERKSVKILDAVELYQADFLYRRDSVFNAESYLAFLGQIAHRYRRQSAVLIQDNALYHKDAAVWAWFADNRHWLEVHQPPSYCPELNPWSSRSWWELSRGSSTKSRPPRPKESTNACTWER
jgi:transposase